MPNRRWVLVRLADGCPGSQGSESHLRACTTSACSPCILRHELTQPQCEATQHSGHRPCQQSQPPSAQCEASAQAAEGAPREVMSAYRLLRRRRGCWASAPRLCG